MTGRLWRRFCGVAAIALAAASAGCAANGSTKIDFTVASPQATGGIGEVRWAVNAEPSTLDPILAYNFYDDQILANMCESLFRLNPDLTTSPLLATAVHNPTPTRWVYDIRKGVRFWDGTSLTAADVAYSLNRNLDPKLGSYFTNYYARVKDIRATGPYQVTVDLTAPDALWNQVLVVGGSSIVEKAWAVRAGKGLGSPKGGLMCTGPYRFAGWARGDNITLRRNDAYWDPAHRGRAQDVVFRFLSDPSAQTQALVSGGVDGMFLIDPSGLPRLASTSGHLYFGKSLMLNYLAPTRRRGALQDADVRKALALIVDRPAIARTIYNGAAQPLRTLVSPTIWGSDPKVQAIYRRTWDRLSAYAAPHVAEAKRLFARAGAPRRPITLAFPTGGAEQQIAESVQSSARQIGMTIRLKGYTLAGLQNILYDPKAQIAAGIDLMYAPFTVDSTDPFGLYQIFIPSVESVYNYPGYANARVTTQLTRAWAEYDPVRRARHVAAAERTIMEDMPLIPLVSPNVMVYMNNRVTGAATSYSIYWSAWANHVGAQ